METEESMNYTAMTLAGAPHIAKPTTSNTSGEGMLIFIIIVVVLIAMAKKKGW